MLELIVLILLMLVSIFTAVAAIIGGAVIVNYVFGISCLVGGLIVFFAYLIVVGLLIFLNQYLY